MSRRILVVEDDPVTRRLEESLLVRDGFQVDTTEDGPAAPAKLAATRYDGIVLDVELPGLDGYEIARRTQQLLVNRDTPLLMVTATTEPDARKRSFEAESLVG